MDDITAAIAERAAATRAWLAADGFAASLEPPALREAASVYLGRGGKGLRPATVLLCCGAVGGEEGWALAAAAAAEVTHNWTLVHDDVIDRDDKRRGGPSVHALLAERGGAAGFLDDDANHYGLAMALLGGDIGPSWAAHLLSRLPENGVTSAQAAFALATELAADVVAAILTGEAEDLELSRAPLENVTLARLEAVLAKKTGALYGWCARAGATIGGGDYDIISNLVRFAEYCGAAFQHVDDVLPYAADEIKVGKPAASDLREGKRTAVVIGAWANATARDRAFIAETLGRADAGDDDFTRLKKMLDDLGGVAYARNRARHYYVEALKLLEAVPAGRYRELLAAWAKYLLDREL
jgi:geranylgeranyl diphosphate synthase type I